MSNKVKTALIMLLVSSLILGGWFFYGSREKMHYAFASMALAISLVGGIKWISGRFGFAAFFILWLVFAVYLFVLSEVFR